jgi:hypothetical protein
MIRIPPLLKTLTGPILCKGYGRQMEVFPKQSPDPESGQFHAHLPCYSRFFRLKSLTQKSSFLISDAL